MNYADGVKSGMGSARKIAGDGRAVTFESYTHLNRIRV